MDTGDVVEASNELAGRWAQCAVGASSTVFSAVGVWPLLALLADGADDRSRSALEEAIRMPAAEAAGGVSHLLNLLQQSTSARGAMALWASEGIILRDEWASRWPPGVVGRLSNDRAVSQRRLDDWTREHTDSLIERFPLQVSGEIGIMLASALALRTQWQDRFYDVPMRIREGPWGGDAEFSGLYRSGDDLDLLAIFSTVAGDVSLVTVAGAGDVDIVLAIGEAEVAGGTVLAKALRAIRGTPVRLGSSLEVGDRAPGVEVVEAEGVPRLLVRVPRFAVTADHRLISNAEVFGLVEATDCSRGHFPGISDTPLCVSEAAQSAFAKFTATGFEGAAVTAIFTRAVSRRLHPTVSRQVHVTFDRPFAFVALHRPSRLAIMCGWVAEGERWHKTAPDLL
jgi:serine protease inhibitor